MSKWSSNGRDSWLVGGAIFWAEDSDTHGIYKLGNEYTVRTYYEQITSTVVAGPFDSLAAAYAAYEVIKGG